MRYLYAIPTYHPVEESLIVASSGSTTPPVCGSIKVPSDSVISPVLGSTVLEEELESAELEVSDDADELAELDEEDEEDEELDVDDEEEVAVVVSVASVRR